ncbi:MAG: DUF427 domain-containing protein [Pseudomonadota bacterium]
MTSNDDKAALEQRLKSHRSAWSGTRPETIEAVGPGEESVWDYPRPPIIDDAPAAVRVLCGDITIANTQRAKRIKETASPPTIYIHPDDCDFQYLKEGSGLSVCEWKGQAQYFDVVVPGASPIRQAAWSYPDPFDAIITGMSDLKDWLCFYPSKVACFVGDERVRPQPGQFYGGWITDQIKGPFKGEPGTGHW